MDTSQKLNQIPSATNIIALCRLNRPTGIWLLLAPCLWSLSLANDGFPSIWYILLFTIGSVLMRSAGCVYNDIVDRNLDKYVERTKSRPLACADVSVIQAWGIIALLSLTSCIILLQFPTTTIALGIGALALVATYPWMKRITYWPQAFLGLTFNWGALMGWSAVKNQIEPPALWLYAAGITWTLIYDTIYAHQDKQDDILVGIKSTALKLGPRTKPFIFCCATTMIICLGIAVWDAGIGINRYVVPGFLFIAAHLFWQCWTVDLYDPEDCLAKFKANQWLGLLILVIILIGRY
ncbi:MAG: 4-hydroxybenzoate octaprenyltransferase [Pseudomonadota bacterium]